MGERKVLNKYIPADFDPSLIPRGKKLSSKDGTVPVRMMLPFSMQCQTCHTFLYRGRKFNSKKEPVQGSAGKYLGIQRFRFYIKCSHCSRPISFLTDPKHADYEMEHGATRNFEMHRNTKKETTTDEGGGGGGGGGGDGTADQQDDEDEEDNGQKFNAKDDPMKALENRVLDSQREMADLDNLEEIKAMNARHLRIDPLEALQLQPLDEDEADDTDLLTAEDEALIRSIRFQNSCKKNSNHTGDQMASHSSSSSSLYKRLTVEDEERLDEQRRNQNLVFLTQEQQQQKDDEGAENNKRKQQGHDSLTMLLPPIKKIKKKKRPQDDGNLDQQSSNTTTAATPNKNSSTNKKNDDNGLASLLGGYGSDSD
ncbi:hypothetical protein ACA910_005865 [Epithemia clementina (nom. ined.)]